MKPCSGRRHGGGWHRLREDCTQAAAGMTAAIRRAAASPPQPASSKAKAMARAETRINKTGWQKHRPQGSSPRGRSYFISRGQAPDVVAWRMSGTSAVRHLRGSVVTGMSRTEGHSKTTTDIKQSN